MVQHLRRQGETPSESLGDGDLRRRWSAVLSRGATAPEAQTLRRLSATPAPLSPSRLLGPRGGAAAARPIGGSSPIFKERPVRLATSQATPPGCLPTKGSEAAVAPASRPIGSN